MTVTSFEGRAASALSTAADGRSTPADERLLVGALFLAALAATLTRGSLLGDPDSQWHVATAEWAWANGALPRVDVFSHTFAGQPWIAKEWLAQFAFAFGYAALGWTGAALLAAGSFAAALCAVFAFVRRRLGILIGLVAALSAFCLAQSQILARPHVLVFPLAAVWTARFVEASEGVRRPPWLLAPAMVLWANVHATFPLGLAIAGALALEAVAGAPDGRRRWLLLEWAAFGAALLLACGLTPYGFEPLLVMLRMAGGNEGVPLINEWQPPRFDARSAVALALIGMAILAFGRRLRTYVFRALLFAFLAWLGCRHERFCGFAAIVGVVLLAGPLARCFDAERLRSRLAGRPPRRPWLLAVAAAASMAAAASLVLRPPAPDPAVTPRAALAFAEARGLTKAKVYNHYNFGGFLIASGVRTFIDGRSDQLFLGGFMRELSALEDGADDKAFVDFIERHGATWAIVGPQTGDFRHLAKAPGWRKAYEDELAAVFERVRTPL
jgi:hypothetical protein